MTNSPLDEAAVVRPERLERSVGGVIAFRLGLLEQLAALLRREEFER
jgi:hypothetical protein